MTSIQQWFVYWVATLIASILLNLPLCDAAWTSYNQERRQTVGNTSILFMTVCAMILRSRDNPGITLPDELNGVSVRLQTIGTRLVFLVTGFSNIARHILPDEAIRNSAKSVGQMLMGRITELGMIEHTASDSFGVTDKARKSEILNNNNSIIAVSHPDVNRLERDVVQNIPTYRTKSEGSRNNKRYKLANTPGFYIDNIRYNSARAVQKITQKGDKATRAFVNGLKQRFREIGSNQPVEGTLNGVRVIYKLDSM